MASSLSDFTLDDFDTLFGGDIDNFVYADGTEVSLDDPLVHLAIDECATFTEERVSRRARRIYPSTDMVTSEAITYRRATVEDAAAEALFTENEPYALRARIPDYNDGNAFFDAPDIDYYRQRGFFVPWDDLATFTDSITMTLSGWQWKEFDKPETPKWVHETAVTANWVRVTSIAQFKEETV